MKSISNIRIGRKISLVLGGIVLLLAALVSLSLRILSSSALAHDGQAGDCPARVRYSN